MGFPLLVRWHLYIESGPRSSTWYIQANSVNAIAADDLTLCSIRPITPILFIMLKKQVLVIQKEAPQLPVPSQYWESIENMNISLCSMKENQHNSSWYFLMAFPGHEQCGYILICDITILFLSLEHLSYCVHHRCSQRIFCVCAQQMWDDVTI